MRLRLDDRSWQPLRYRSVEIRENKPSVTFTATNSLFCKHLWWRNNNSNNKKRTLRWRRSNETSDCAGMLIFRAEVSSRHSHSSEYGSVYIFSDWKNFSAVHSLILLRVLAAPQLYSPSWWLYICWWESNVLYEWNRWRMKLLLRSCSSRMSSRRKRTAPVRRREQRHRR